MSGSMRGWRFKTPRGLTSNRHAGRPDRANAGPGVCFPSFANVEQERRSAVGVSAYANAPKEGKAMRLRTILPLVLTGVLAASSPAPAQQNDTGIPTETQQRLRSGPPDIPWLDLIGLVGLVGLLGLRRQHPEDSYHPSPIE